MVNSPASIYSRFKNASGTTVITMEELSEIVGLPRAFPELVKRHVADMIDAVTGYDSIVAGSQREYLYFAPEIYPQENGASLPYKNFWLQIHIDGIPAIPVMGIKFMEISEGRFEVSSPYLTSITGKGELYYRPVLGHHIISNVEALIHSELKKPLKPEPVFPRSPTAP